MFCNERGKRGSHSAKAKGPHERNVIYKFIDPIFFLFSNITVVKRKEEKIREGEKKIPKMACIGIQFKKIIAFTLWCKVTFLDPHSC